MAHGAPLFQYYTHISECRVQMGLEALKQLSFCVNTTVLCLKLLSIKLRHIQLRSCLVLPGLVAVVTGVVATENTINMGPDRTLQQ